MNWLKHKFRLINDVLNDFLGDLKSLRFQLIIMAYVFNFYLIKHSPDNLKWGIGLLTAVYGFYFISKFQQYSNPTATNAEPINSNRNPDEI